MKNKILNTFTLEEDVVVSGISGRFPGLLLNLV